MNEMKIDKLEQRIKELFSEGEIFSNKTQIYKMIGLEYLGIKKLNGGKQRNRAFEIVSQYMKIESLEIGKQAVVCVEIYDEPRYIEKPDNRGKRGFYIDRTVPILLTELPVKNKLRITANQLAHIMGLCVYEYMSYDAFKDELKKKNPKFSSDMYNQFYSRYKPVIDTEVFVTLDRLASDYNVISYRKCYWITDNGRVRLSSRQEDVYIQETEKTILSEYGFKNKSMVYWNGKQKNFYSDVIKQINIQYDCNWERYTSIIDIQINTEKLKSLKESVLLDVDIINFKHEVQQHFITYLQQKTERDYNGKNKKADEVVAEWERDIENMAVEDIVADKAILDLYQLGTYSKKEVLEQYIPKPKPFRFNDNYLDVQDGLIEFFIGEADSKETEMDLEWLEFLDEAV